MPCSRARWPAMERRVVFIHLFGSLPVKTTQRSPYGYYWPWYIFKCRLPSAEHTKHTEQHGHRACVQARFGSILMSAIWLIPPCCANPAGQTLGARVWESDCVWTCNRASEQNRSKSGQEKEQSNIYQDVLLFWRENYICSFKTLTVRHCTSKANSSSLPPASVIFNKEAQDQTLISSLCCGVWMQLCEKN